MPTSRPFLRVVGPPPPGAGPRLAASALGASAFSEVYQQYWRYVARIANRLLGRDDEVDDVLQEVFLIALQRPPLVDNPGAMRGWLASVTVKRVATRLRWRRLRAVLRLDDVDDDRLVCRELGPEQRSMIASASRTLDRLPPKERIAWTLRVVEEEPLETVARMCGCSLATAKRRVAAAEARMKELAGE